ncbi:FKBP-type peptidyl-prolyl cis-trans isomerase N-terminal domain-containing protein [Gaopeijia maritima]|uniref:Peptidyl-prolyl cis-trans isomerase n=1 Tax=Gaopeijia maritima TaxID=3119007 RepID=A0ABU9EAW0_9BACT
MAHRLMPALAAATLLASACADAADTSSAALETQEQIASYGIGLNMGQQIAPAEGSLDMAAFQRGIADAMAGNEPAIEATEIQVALQAFSETVNQRMMEEREAAGAENRAAGEAYLAENAAREGVQVTASGLQYEVLEEGTGASPAPTDRVAIHYKGSLIDGTEFDASGETPLELGVNQFVSGFSEGLQLMTVGSTYRFVIPSDLAYGPQGSGPVIGPDATLVFEVELLEIL